MLVRWLWIVSLCFSLYFSNYWWVSVSLYRLISNSINFFSFLWIFWPTFKNWVCYLSSIDLYQLLVYFLGFNSLLRHCRCLLLVSHPFVDFSVVVFAEQKALILIQNSSFFYFIVCAFFTLLFVLPHPKIARILSTFSFVLAL